MRRNRVRRARSLVVFGLLALAHGISSVAAAGRLDRFLERKMRKAKVPGMAVALVVDGEVALARGYGWADMEHEIPATADTLFLIGSISKVFNATGVMRLHDRRGLDLDADVSRYLPFELRHPDFPEVPITLRQLMTHTSSISDVRSEISSVWRELVTEGSDWQGDLTQLLIDYLTPGGRYYDPSTSFNQGPPGAVSEYSNMGVTLQAAIVEQVTGLPFETFQRRQLFRPLRMRETSWFLRDLDQEHLAVPYAWAEGDYERLPHNGMAFWPAGQMRTSARQLAKLAILHLQDGKFGRHRILRRKTARRMRQVQFPEVAPEAGLAFVVAEFGGVHYVLHNGGFYGCSTLFWIDLDSEVAVIILTNGDPLLKFERRRVEPLQQILSRLFEEARRLAEGTEGD